MVKKVRLARRTSSCRGAEVAHYRIPQPALADRSDAARQSSLRSLNLATVIQRVYGSPAPLSRADVAADTGLTRSTVSRLVDDLVTGGLVQESDPQTDGQRGRPAVPLAPAADTWFALGLEINVGRLAARAVDLTGKTLSEQILEVDLRGSDPETVLGRLGELARGVLDSVEGASAFAGVQVALPGLVDLDAGVLLRAPNLGWWEVAPRPRLAAALDMDPTLIGVGNEADFAAWTIAWDAPGRPSENGEFLYVSGEVGIGSALVTSGKAMVGGHGWAGEIGHVCVDRHGPACACGARGCLEAYVGQAALSSAAGTQDTGELLERLAAGDVRASRAVAEAAETLGVVLAGALNLLDVSRIVLGGHLGRLAPHLIPGIEVELERRVVGAPFEALSVTSVPDDRDMPSLGAAYVALQRVLESPADWLAG